MEKVLLCAQTKKMSEIVHTLFINDAIDAFRLPGHWNANIKKYSCLSEVDSAHGKCSSLPWLRSRTTCCPFYLNLCSRIFYFGISHLTIVDWLESVCARLLNISRRPPDLFARSLKCIIRAIRIHLWRARMERIAFWDVVYSVCVLPIFLNGGRSPDE